MVISKFCSASLQTGKWEWKFENTPVNIYYEEHEQDTADNVKNILMIPTISDVSTVEEWRVVAKDIVGRKGELGYRATIVDWPGLGYSDRPSLNYNADVMESFLVQLMTSPNSPVANAGKLILVYHCTVSLGLQAFSVEFVPDQSTCFLLSMLG